MSVDEITSDGKLICKNETDPNLNKSVNINDVLASYQDENEVLEAAESDESKRYYYTNEGPSEPEIPEVVGGDLASTEERQQQILT